MYIGITVEHLVAQVHTKNGLAESLFKCHKLISRFTNEDKTLCFSMGHVIYMQQHLCT